jgi:hypothetical protein
MAGGGSEAGGADELDMEGELERIERRMQATMDQTDAGMQARLRAMQANEASRRDELAALTVCGGAGILCPRDQGSCFWISRSPRRSGRIS